MRWRGRGRREEGNTVRISLSVSLSVDISILLLFQPLEHSLPACLPREEQTFYALLSYY